MKKDPMFGLRERTHRIYIIEKGKEKGITLDNIPAGIYGLKLNFPIVSNGYVRQEYSWAAVERIINDDGKFRS